MATHAVAGAEVEMAPMSGKGRFRQKKLGRVGELLAEESLWPGPSPPPHGSAVDGETVLEIAEEQQMLRGQEKEAELEGFEGSNRSVLGGNALAKHAIFLVLWIAFGAFIIAPVVTFVYFTYDPYLVDFYIPELPSPPIPQQKEKWGYGVPFPTNRDLNWITAEFWGDSFLVGGAEGTLLSSTFDSLTSSASIPRKGSVQRRENARNDYDDDDDESDDSLSMAEMQERYPGYCSRLHTASEWDSGSPSAWEDVSWDVIHAPPSAGTIEAGAVIGDALLVQLRENDGSFSNFALERTGEGETGEELDTDALYWRTADFALDGSVAFGNGVWLGVSRALNKLFRSEDGRSWEEQSITVASSGDVQEVVADLKAIAFGNGRFVLLAIKQTQEVSYVSTGTGVLPWLHAALDSTFSSSTETGLITFGSKASQFVAFYDHHLHSSPDGLEWEEVAVVDSLMWSLSCGYRRCVGIGSDNLVVESDNGGVTWTLSRSIHKLNAAACRDDDICVAVGPRGAVFFSVVFSSWHSVGAALGGGVGSLVVSNKGSMDSLFFGQWKASSSQPPDTEYAQVVDDAFYPVSATENIVNENGMVVSCNGLDWFLTTNPVAASFKFIVEGNGLWVGVSEDSHFYVSTDPSDPTSWQLSQSKDPDDSVLLDIKFDGLYFIVIGYITHTQFLSSDVEADEHGLVFTSEDGRHWESADSNVVISQLAWDKANFRYIGLEPGEGLYTSKNAKDWDFSQEGVFSSVAVNNRTGVALAAGEDALYVSSDGGLSWKAQSSCKCSPCAVSGTLSFIPEIGGFFHSGAHGLLSVTYDDGVTWKTVVLPFTVTLENVTYGSGMLVVRAADMTTNSVAGSVERPSSGALLTLPVDNLQYATCAIAS